MKKFVVLAVALLPFTALAQYPTTVTVPEASPAAETHLQLGITHVAVKYGSPAVKGREVFGKLEPWDQMWRAGANWNTVLSASTPFTVEGKELPAGEYGLHIIPRQGKPWTVVLSRATRLWGSYAHDPADEALRVEIAPVAIPNHEFLEYRFTERGPDYAVLAMEWEKVRLPIRLGVNLQATVTEHLRQQVKGIQWFSADELAGAATYLHDQGWAPELVTAWVARSVEMKPNVYNLSLQADLKEAAGDAAAAQQLRAQAYPLGSLNELGTLGYTYLGKKNTTQAMAAFHAAAKQFPDSHRPLAWLANGYKEAGDKANALKYINLALAKAPESARPRLEQMKKDMGG